MVTFAPSLCVLPSHSQPSRRELLAFGWPSFLLPKHISLAGARFRILRNGRGRRRYLVIHGNEESAREVLVRHMETHEGVAYVVEGHTRNVKVQGLSLDPNRMFSRVGAEASLRRLNQNEDDTRMQRALGAPCSSTFASAGTARIFRGKDGPVHYLDSGFVAVML